MVYDINDIYEMSNRHLKMDRFYVSTTKEVEKICFELRTGQYEKHQCPAELDWHFCKLTGFRITDLFKSGYKHLFIVDDERSNLVSLERIHEPTEEDRNKPFTHDEIADLLEMVYIHKILL